MLRTTRPELLEASSVGLEEQIVSSLACCETPRRSNGQGETTESSRILCGLRRH